jgi:plastocyanin
MGTRIVGFRVIARVALAAMLANSCGTASPTAPTTSTSPTAAPHVLPQVIMIMESRPVPEEVTIAVGDRVSFMNHDRATYTVAGGREPSRSDCPEISVVGMLTPGDTRTTEPFTTARTCEFHVAREQSPLLTGRIIIR